MLHKIIEYKTDRISDCRILNMAVVVMKGHNDCYTVTLVEQSFKNKKTTSQCIE